MVAVEVAQLPCPGLDDLPLGLLHLCGEPVEAVAPGDGVDGGRLGSVVFEYRLEYGIDLVTVGTVEAFVDDLLLNERDGAAALPPGTPLTG